MTKKFSNYVRGEGTVPEGMVKGKASKRKQQPNRGWGGVCRVAWAQLKTREFSDVACKQCDRFLIGSSMFKNKEETKNSSAAIHRRKYRHPVRSVTVKLRLAQLVLW